MVFWRALLAGALVLGVVACGGDDSATVASTTSTTVEPLTGAPDQNPCAPGGSGTVPGQTSAFPAEGATAVLITGREYAFDGADALKAGGQVGIFFRNTGKELHELVIQKIDDSEKRPVDQLLRAGDPSQFATRVAATFACPGATSAPIAVDLSAPGRYVLVCFILTGTTPKTKPADFGKGGAPHALNGMVAEVDVAG